MTDKEIDLFKEIQGVMKDTYNHNDQMILISKWVNDKLSRKQSKLSIDEIRSRFHVWYISNAKDKYRATILTHSISTKGNYGHSDINNRWKAYLQPYIDMKLVKEEK